MQTEQLSTNKQESSDDFYNEIIALKKLEEKNKGTVYFEGCDPFELNEEDKDLYRRFISKNLTVKELEQYSDKLRKSGNESQRNFVAYIANMFQFTQSKKLGGHSSRNTESTLH